MLILKMGKALEYLHQRDIVHGRILLESILFHTFHIELPFLVDFDGTAIDGTKGAHRYIMGDVTLGAEITFASDMQALGILIYEVLADGRVKPDPKDPLTALISPPPVWVDEATKAKYEAPCSCHAPLNKVCRGDLELAALLERMMAHDPVDRPTPGELLYDPCLQSE
jgi:serine/threonine protein kinase